jgi:hypothetical protein
MMMMIFYNSGITFGAAKLVHNKIDYILSHLINEFFYGNSVYVWFRMSLSDAWIDSMQEVRASSRSILPCPIRSRNIVPYVGTSSYIWRSIITTKDSSTPLIQFEVFMVSFDLMTRRSQPLSTDYKTTMLDSLISRGEPNKKPTIPEFPAACTSIWTGTMMVREEHEDANKHVHYKLYIFFAFECLKKVNPQQISSKLSTDDDVIVRDCFILFEKESVSGDTDM